MCLTTPETSQKSGFDILLEAIEIMEARDRNANLQTRSRPNLQTRSRRTLRRRKENIPIINTNEKIRIGPNGNSISKKLYQNIKWSNPSAAARKLAAALFSMQVLGTHSLSGKPSPAFIGRGKPKKSKLDEKKVGDIIFIVCKNSGTSAKEVRAAITTKCADTAKKLRKMIGKA